MSPALLLVLHLVHADPASASTPAPASGSASASAGAVPVAFEDRTRAASAAGLSSFLGMVGGAIVPALGYAATGIVVGFPVSQDVLMWMAVAGGALGAGTGGAIGAWSTTSSIGVPVVAGAALIGAAAGLVPAILSLRAQTEQPQHADMYRTVHSVSLLGALVGASGGAAVSAALLARNPRDTTSEAE